METKNKYESPKCELLELMASAGILNGSIEELTPDPEDPWNAAPMDILVEFHSLF